MVLKSVSAKSVIALTELKFKPTNNNWITDAIVIIGEGLGLMGYNGNLVNTPIDVVVENNTVKIPCSVEQLLYLEYKGNRIAPLNSVKGIKGDTSKIATIPNTWYTLNPSYLHFSDNLNGKTITIHALCLSLDEDGYPLIPDTDEHKVALSWYVMYILLLRGQSHPTLNWKECFQMWELYYPRAQNKTVSQDLDRMELFKDLWTGWATDYTRAGRFNGITNGGQTFNTNNDISQITQTNTTIVHIEDSDGDLGLGTDL